MIPVGLSRALAAQALRRLLRERGFSLTVLLTLTLCIGANVAMFAVVDAVLLRPLPFPDPDRLVVLNNAYPGAGVERSDASVANYYERRGNISALKQLAIYQSGDAIIGEAGSPRRAPVDRVSPEFFHTLGITLATGRAFEDADMTYDNAQKLILTHGFWQRRFNGDPQVLGQTLMVNGIGHEVIGVLSSGFRFLNSEAEFYLPLASALEDREANRRHSNNVQMLARLDEGATLPAAQQQVNALNEARWEHDPYAAVAREAGFRTDVITLREHATGDAKPILLILQAGSLALLAIGCVNLSNLLLVRAKNREKEAGIRQALGAGKGQFVSETLFETLVLAAAGGLSGLALGWAGVRLLVAHGASRLPLASEIALDGRVAAVCLAGSIVVGLALVVPVVLFSYRRNLAPALQSESRSGTASRAAQRARHGFIIAQVALAFALLSGAGLLGMSLKNALQTSPGFRTERVLTASLSLPWKRYPDAETRQRFLERLLDELRSLPGVVEAGFSDGLPFSGRVSDNATAVEGREPAPGESIRTHYTSFAMGDYWQSLGIPLLEGRFIRESDTSSGERVCLVDEVFAQRYWPGGSALGKRIASDVEVNDENAMSIVGVVGAVKQRDLADTAPLGAVYVPYHQRPATALALALRTNVSAEGLIPALEKLVLRLDPELPLDDAKIMQQRIDESLLMRRSPAVLASLFAVVALLLAAVGTYGVIAYSVAQTRREIGVRLALGASPSRIVGRFLALGMQLLLAGLAIGFGIAWATGRAMRSALFAVEPFSPGVLATAALAMTLVMLLATVGPSRRAARVTPLEAMTER